MAVIKVSFKVLLTFGTAALLAAACSRTPTDVVTGSEGADYRLCTEPPGSWTDVTGEDEGWRSSAVAVAWVDDAGCAVRLDHLWHRFGDDHCDWGQVETISIGLPSGTPYTGNDAEPPGQDWDPMFFFNTDGAVSGFPPGRSIAINDVPTTSRDIGLTTTAGRRLLLAEDEQVLYEVQDDAVRVFERVLDDEVSCA